MGKKGKIVLVCGTAVTNAIHHIVKSLQKSEKVIIVHNEKKGQFPFEEPVDFKITNCDLSEIQANTISTAKPIQDWSRKNYQQRNRKYKSKRR